MPYKKIIAYILAASLLISSLEITLKIAGNTFHPVQLTFLRFIIGGLALLLPSLISMRKNNIRPALKDWTLLALNGFMVVVISMILFQLAVDHAKASTVAVLFSCNPVFTLLLSYLFLQEKLSKLTLLSIILSSIGLLVIVNPANLNEPLGMTFALLSAVAFSVYSIISRLVSIRTGLSGLAVTGFTLLIGSIELLALMLLTHLQPLAAVFSGVPGLETFVHIPIWAGIAWDYVPLLLLAGIGNSAAAFALYFLIMELSNVSLASIPFFIKPGLAPLLSFLILSENITVHLIIGIVIILAGSLLIIYSNRTHAH
ncbi:EamA family transporter [Paenibacillus sp. HN-1]|uniref:DMT family transporter n=1 Tax=Paenibacillus TaxID=44249 RepID=UPI001CAA10F2|nr:MULTISPECIES: DMT family transporter [Paenibacillus]MBY9079072.1 EamA family transporter [Paenibacillus sp. CGMCC 1.18879]MBY9086850.1 EamA family transporter [Paenibacillus sinensis]